VAKGAPSIGVASEDVVLEGEVVWNVLAMAFHLTVADGYRGAEPVRQSVAVSDVARWQGVLECARPEMTVELRESGAMTEEGVVTSHLSNRVPRARRLRKAEECCGNDDGKEESAAAVRVHWKLPGRLTAYEFSGNTAANAAVLSAATRG